MRKWMSLCLALALLAVFSFGCAGNRYAGDTKIKCPKCGAVFTIDEGVAEMQKKGGGN